MKKFLSDVLIDCGLTVNGTTSLVGTATATTVATSDNSTKIATTAWVKSLGYTSYSHWNLKTNGVQRTTVTSGGTLDITAGTGVTVGYGAGGIVTINATGSVDYISNVTLNGSSLDFTGVGNAFAGSVDLSTLNPTVKTVYETVKNVSGTTIYKGTPLAVVAGQTSGNISDVIPADASDPAKMPAVFIANADIADEAEGEAVLFGYLSGLDTSLYQSGTTVYVAPGGGWTDTKPVYPNKIQNLGVITKQHATNGAGIVTGVGRANDLPNLTAGKIWVGTTNYPIESTTVHIDETNGRLGVGTILPTEKLHVNGRNILVGDLKIGRANSVDDGSGDAVLAIGKQALNTYTGNTSSMTAVGDYALAATTNSGTSNDAFGYKALFENTTGTYNSAFGNSAGIKNNGTQNVFFGQFSGPYYATLTGGYNTFIGPLSGIQSNGAAAKNTGIGASTLYSLTTGIENVAISSAALFNVTTGSGNIGIGFNTGRSITTGSYNVVIGNNVTGLSATLANNIIIADGQGNRRINVDGSGNVGIGTTSPATKLNVSGNIAVSSGSYLSFIDSNLTYNTIKRSTSVGGIQIDTGGTASVNILDNGNVGIGTTSPTSGYKLDVIGAIRIENVNGLYIDAAYAYGDNSGGGLSIYNRGTTRALRVLSTTGGGWSDILLNPYGAKVGIGTLDPTQALHVSGNLRVTGAYYDSNNSAGTSGQILKSTGTGTDWVTLSEITGVDGTGTANYVAKWSDADTITNSQVFDNGTNVGIGVTTPNEKLQVGGNINAYINGGIDAGLFASTSAGSTTIALRSNGVTHFNGGNVGIGTTSPGEKLEVNGVLQIKRDGDHPALRFVEINGGTSTTRGYIASGDWAVNGGAIDDFGISGSVTGDLLLATNAGTERLRIQNSTGNVGIGTTSPTQKLDVSGNIQATTGLILTGNAAKVSTTYSGVTATNFFTDANGGVISVDGSNRISLRQGGVSGTDAITIAGSGNVGIGTTSPGYKLDVNGTLHSTDLTIADTIYHEGDTNTYMQFHAADEWRVVTGGTERLEVINARTTVQNVLVANDFVGVGTTSPAGVLDVQKNNTGDQLVRFWNTNTAGTGSSVVRIANSGNNNNGSRIEFTDNQYYVATISADRSQGIIFRTSATGAGPVAIDERMRITAAGNVGIGTTSPTAKFVVQGTAGNLYIDDLGAGYNYYDASNVHNFRNTAGTSRLYINTSTGNVGIGTTSPNHKLDIYSNENVPLRIHRPSNANLDSSGAWGIGFSTRSDAINSTTDTRAGIFSYYNGNLFLAAANTSIVADPDAYARLTILNTGYVGIGTTSPSRQLQVAGSIAQAGSTWNGNTRIHTYPDNYHSWYYHSSLLGGQGSADVMTYYQNFVIRHEDSTNVLVINGSGNVGIGTTSPGVKLQVGDSGDTSNYVRVRTATSDVYVGANPSSTHIGINNGGKILQTLEYPLAIGTTQNQELYLGANNAIIATLVDGKFGIGTTSPSEKLHVVGNVQIEGGSTSVVLETNNKGADPAGVLFGEYDAATTYGAIVDYVIYDAGRDNMRSGTFSAVWNIAETRYNDVSTVDIGDTSVVTLTSQINGADVELIVSGDAAYTIKFNVKLIK